MNVKGLDATSRASKSDTKAKDKKRKVKIAEHEKYVDAKAQREIFLKRRGSRSRG